MGSSQSSTGNTNNKGSFSIDPSGKISQPRPRETTPPGSYNNNYQEHNQHESLSSSSSSSSASSSSSSSQDSSHSQPEATAAGGHHETISHHNQLSTLNTMTKSSSDDGLSLQEADEVLTRMKTKYKPNSVGMAGKNWSVFEEIERNLVHCYKTHKDRPLHCAKISQEYKEYVRQQRSQILRESVKADTPPAT